MVIIKNNTIPYLDERILNSYNNVNLLSSTEGSQIRMNSLMLCALSHTLKIAFDEDDEDHTIITEFSLEELKQVKEFCMRGTCNAMSEHILQAFGLLKTGEIKLIDNDINEIKKEPLSPRIPYSKAVIKKFGLHKLEPIINKISEKNNTSMTQIFESDTGIKTENEVKNEESDIVDENLEYDIAMDYSSDEYLPSPIKKNKRKKKLDYDDDWEPEKLSKVKRNKTNIKLTQGIQTQNEVKNEEIDVIDEQPIEIENLEYDIAMDYSSDDSLLYNETSIRKKKSRQSQNDLLSGINEGKHLPRGVFSKEQFAEHEAKFENFELPNPLEDYMKHSVVMSNGNYKRYKDKEQKWSGATIQKSFQCSECQLRFLASSECRYHETRYHNKHLQCTLCHRVDKVENIQEFKRHVFNHLVLGLGGFKECIRCGKTHQRKNIVIKHLKFFGPLHNEECTQCLKKMSSFKEYQEHVNEQHYGVWKYRCGFVNCGEIFDNAKDCKSHTKSIHHEVVLSSGLPKKSRALKVKKEICEECGFFGQLIQHICKSKRKAKTEYPCNKCKQIFSSAIELTKHKRNRNAPCLKFYMKYCQLCGKGLMPGKLNYHMISVHTKSEDRPHKCSTCGKGFAQKAGLKDHLNLHTGEKPYKCLYCPSSFASSGTHRMHQKGHLGIKRNHGEKRQYNWQ